MVAGKTLAVVAHWNHLIQTFGQLQLCGSCNEIKGMNQIDPYRIDIISQIMNN